MTDFNQAIVLGNLTKDPELRYTPNGQSVVNFSVATNRRWIDKNTQQAQEAVEFHNVVAWGKLAEICNQILYKGRKALIVGRLQTRNWEGQDGVKRYVTEIVADHISATGQPKAMGEANLEETTSSPAPKPAADNNKPAYKVEEKKDNEKKDEEIDLDEIPF
jgi:single-strand DNA-binding protein